MSFKIPFAAGGGSFRVDSIVEGTIASGNTGVLLNPSVTGKKVIRLYLLVCTGSSTQTGITLTRDGVTLESEKTLTANNFPGLDGNIFVVARNLDPAQDDRNYYQTVECQALTLTKNAGNTTQAIAYAYEIGEYV